MGPVVHFREGHENNFTPLRLIMALAVLVGHAMIIGARDLGAEPMVYGDFSISYMAVNAFFIASGFLVTASMMYRGQVGEFVAARGLRIYPALIAHVIIVMFVVGLANTTLSLREYITHWDVWKQIPHVLSFFSTDFVLPGVFADNHEQLASAPLWTLRFEILAYIGTALLFSMGLMKQRWMLVVPFVGACALWLLCTVTGFLDQLPATIDNVMRFALPYGMGAALWAYRKEIPFRLWVIPLLMAAAWVSRDDMFGEIMMNVAVGYILFFLAYAKWPGTTWLSKGWTWPDLSYGAYIWHWPILQWMSAQVPGVTTWQLLAVCIPATLLVSWASWSWIEKPMLAQKSRVSGWFKRSPSLAT